MATGRPVDHPSKIVSIVAALSLIRELLITLISEQSRADGVTHHTTPHHHTMSYRGTHARVQYIRSNSS